MTDLSDFEDTYSQITQLCDKSGSQGFDVHAGQTWIYPTNYPVREYQYNIIEKALFENTLVSLPTGLGKTFIAAVVMYNFYRWYPNGKIVFIAPTRPLVKQQVDACYNIMAIPQEATIELTGSKEKKSRLEIWNNKRVFFVTPQILQNDLQTDSNFGSKIRCIVFDEAHRARGNHAYCEVIRKLLLQNNVFRVLALSATPGNNAQDTKDVIKNLLISRLEFRTEESPDVSPYVFERSLETVVVPLDSKLSQVKNDYLEVLERYTRCLIDYKVIQGNCSALTKGKIFITLKNFQEKNRGGSCPNYSEIVKNLNICVTLYHAYELLIRHGLRSFLSFFEEHITKPLLRGNINIVRIMEDIRNYLGPLTIAEPLPDGTYTEVDGGIKFGHPKYYKLAEILIDHFTKNKDSRIIVFFEYRESVKEAYTLLMKSNPLIRPRIFLGQGTGNTQKIQLQVVQAFRDGKCNTLLSTCIGEEGLDVGEVNLIVCFDISNKSPIRMIQRMGRTGRKGEGKVIILVTFGKEQQTLQDCLDHKKYLSKNLCALPDLTNSLYTKNQRMIPDNITPRCEKVYITIKKNPVTKNMNLKDMFKRKKSTRDKKINVLSVDERLSPVTNLSNKIDPLGIAVDKTKIDCGENIEANRRLQSSSEICHSSDSQMLLNFIQKASSKRFNIPVTQYGSQQPTKNLKQGDIRDIFKKAMDMKEIKMSQEIQDLSVESTSQFKSDSKEPKSIMWAESFDEISIYLTLKNMSEEGCKVCDNLFTCPKLPTISEKVNLNDWVQPNLSILSSISKDSFNVFKTRHKSTANAVEDSKFHSHLNLSCSELKMEVENFMAIADDTFFPDIPLDTKQCKTAKQADNVIRVSNNNVNNEIKLNKFKSDDMEVLSFFKLNSIADLFKDEESVPMHLTHNVCDKSNENMIVSSPESPILCTFQRTKQFQPRIKASTSKISHENVKAKHFDEQLNNSYFKDKQSENNFPLNEESDFAEIEDIFDLTLFGDKSPEKPAICRNVFREENRNNLLNSQMEKHHKNRPKETSSCKTFNIANQDICDLSAFGLCSISEEGSNNLEPIRGMVDIEITKRKKLNDGGEKVTKFCSSSGKISGAENVFGNKVNRNGLKENSITAAGDPSQYSITQVLSLIDKAPKQSNGEHKRNSEPSDYFEELLSQMK